MWKYRVMKRVFDCEEFYGIYEVFYNKKGEIKSHSTEPVEPHGNTLEELKQDIEWMLEATKKEVLDYDHIVFYEDDLYEDEDVDVL